MHCDVHIISAYPLPSPYDVGGAGLGIGAEKEKKYVKDTILYDLLEVDPAASQGDGHYMTDLLCCALSLLLLELFLLLLLLLPLLILLSLLLSLLHLPLLRQLLLPLLSKLIFGLIHYPITPHAKPSTVFHIHLGNHVQTPSHPPSPTPFHTIPHVTTPMLLF